MKIEAKKHSSLSPRIKKVEKKPTIKFYKGNKMKSSLPPLKNGHNFSAAAMSGYSSEFYKVRSSFSRIPIRDMSKAFDNRLNNKRKSKPEIKKKDPRKALINRLKLLDSVGESNPVSTSGSIRKGYVVNAKVRAL